MNFNKEELIKNPLNYTGGKFRLLPQILPLFPSEINTFVDLFCGGCDVGVNIKANKIICNDLESNIINLYNEWKKLDSTQALSMVASIINKYSLSKTNKEGYLKLREDYNKGDKSWYMFYSLVCYSFNNQIRFNKKGEFNLPFGKDRSYFNDNLKSKFIEFINKIKELNIEFTNMSFNELSVDDLNSEDFVYCDPPYLITCATYNENNKWDETREYELLDLLDKLNERGIKFALSNVLESKGKENTILKEWSNNYNIHYLNYNYSNCNYHKKDRNKSNIEVLITNY